MNCVCPPTAIRMVVGCAGREHAARTSRKKKRTYSRCERPPAGFAGSPPSKGGDFRVSPSWRGTARAAFPRAQGVVLRKDAFINVFPTNQPAFEPRDSELYNHNDDTQNQHACIHTRRIEVTLRLTDDPTETLSRGKI